jgi:hypothetical protein
MTQATMVFDYYRTSLSSDDPVLVDILGLYSIGLIHSKCVGRCRQQRERMKEKCRSSFDCRHLLSHFAVTGCNESTEGDWRKGHRSKA